MSATIEIGELARMLDERVDSLAPRLLPNGRKVGAWWRTGSVADEPGESLAVNLNGSRRGWWTDFAEPEGTTRRSGDMLKLVALVLFGGRLGDAVAWAKSALGLDGLDPRRLATERARVIERARDADEDAARKAEAMRGKAQSIWIGAQPLDGSPAELYLAARGIDLSLLPQMPRALRYHPAVWNSEARRGLPALVAAVVALDGTHIATHRIWIEPDGQGLARKHSGLAEPKKAIGRFWGGHIPLCKGGERCTLRDVKPGTHVAIAEGIEDGLTVACALDGAMRTLAAVTLGNIGAMALPEQVRGVTIIAQRDPEGSPAARTLEKVIRSIQDEGRVVRRALPPVGVKDANDLARGVDQHQQEHAA